MFKNPLHFSNDCPFSGCGRKYARLWSVLCFLLPLFVLVCLGMFHSDGEQLIKPGTTSTSGSKPPRRAAEVTFTRHGVDLRAYQKALQRHSVNGVILLALTDSSFLDMTLNFYETSIKSLGIKNYLFVASDKAACGALSIEGVACHVYMELGSGTTSSMYGSKEFKKKMNVRTYMIYDALRLGYAVLHSDVDMMFLKNPFMHLNCLRRFCDVTTLWDNIVHNAGFLYVNPTGSSLSLYKRMEVYASTTNLDDQAALNKAIKQAKASKAGLQVKVLDMKKFLPGVAFFEKADRKYAREKPCESCVVVHNNWIVSREAKTYRFREYHFWVYDGGQYYSSPDRKYLLYSNPHSAAIGNIKKSEQEALKNALAIGQILNRTVILPKMHCKNEKDQCLLNSVLGIAAFDKHFGNRYRESTFLSHPKVPDEIKRSAERGNVYLIQSKRTKEIFHNHVPTGVTLLSPERPNVGADSLEIQQWFGNDLSPVLVFHSLYGAFDSFTDASVDSEFRRRITMGLVPGSYRQLKLKSTA